VQLSVQALNVEHMAWKQERKLSYLNGFKGHSLCKLMTCSCKTKENNKKNSKVVMMVGPLVSAAILGFA